MSERSVEAFLAKFGPEDATFKLLTTLVGVVPGSPDIIYYQSIDEARLLVASELEDDGLERARALLKSPAFQQAMDVADAIDTGDVGITVLTGIRSALTFFFGDKNKALDTDAQQGADAVLKAAGIAWMTHRLFSGSIPEKAEKLRSLPSGKALLTWYAAVEVCLPFADDLALGAGSMLSGLLQKYGAGNLKKLDAIAGGGAAEAAGGMLGGLTQPIEEMIQEVSVHTKTIAEQARQYLPPAISTAGTVAGAVATAADAMPVYRLLVARLAIEAALLEARS
ncbi:MAG TPA: hypothetical protein PLA94_21340 [Myxococcota bacterium]|nr:hypothetical protein [Myxococcota bacterium]